LIPYANNPRLHSEADVERIAASIAKWGWTNPALVDGQGVLVAGHCRVAAAAKLALKSIPVVVARGWSDEESKPIGWPIMSLPRGQDGTPICSAPSCVISNSVVSTSI